MNSDQTGVLNAIVNKSESELILFFIITMFGMVLVLIPICRMAIADRKERRKAQQEQNNLERRTESEIMDKNIQREAQILGIIKENSEVIAGLKVALENIGLNNGKSLDQIVETQNKVLETLQELKCMVDTK